MLIVVSECPFGLGENQILFVCLAAACSPRRPWSALIWRSTGWECSRPPALLPSWRGADLDGTGLGDEEVRAMFMTPFASVQEAVDAALLEMGPEARVLFLKEASITVPRVRARAEGET